MKMKYDVMWQMIEDEFVARAEVAYNQQFNELSLIAAIIVQAAKDKDLEYFKDNNFFYHCKLMRISPIFVGYVIREAYKIIENGKPFLLSREDDYE